MRRWVGLALALALVAGAVGYRLGTDRAPAPTSFAAEPVPAAAPSYPVIPAIVLPDDPDPALEPGLRMRRQRVGSSPFEVSVPVPRGWVRSDSTPGEWRWYPSAQLTGNLYFIKVLQVGNRNRSIDAAVRGRISELEGAAAVTELDVRSARADRFLASYVTGKHRRFAYEGFLARPGSEVADVHIAVVGRRADRAGLDDLFDRLMSGAVV